jgi:hypothetical protein
MMAAQSPPLFTRRLETTKFTVLLLALLLLFLVHPFLDVQGLRRVLPVLFSAVLLGGLYVMSDRRTLFRVGLVLIVPARAFSAVEAVFGQFFLAILVAKLVGALIVTQNERGE